MVQYLKGTVFNSGAQTLVNAVNTEGVMGKGIALEFSLRYPKMLDEYEEFCENDELRVGHPKLHRMYNTYILSFPTKKSWRRPSKLSYIEESLRYFVDNYKKIDIKSIAFPKLGTSNGGLEWNEVKNLMEKYLNNLDIDVYICLDELKEAEGIEKDMLNYLNNLLSENEANDLKKILGIKVGVIENLQEYGLPNRFFEIAGLHGIGKNGYKKIFSHCYEKVNNANNKNEQQVEQLSFF